MTKPLELTIYPPIEQPTPETFEQWRNLKRLSKQFMMEKRFTNGELAAEYWAARSEHWKTNWNALASGIGINWFTTDTAQKATTLHRFATTPSYDEVGLMSPQRIQRKRTKGWRMPPNTIYIGRGTKWGNPWKVGSIATVFVDHATAAPGTQYVRDFEITPAMAVEFYRIAFTPDAPEARAELAGKDLACWCPLDQPCHADVLLALANETNQSEGGTES